LGSSDVLQRNVEYHAGAGSSFNGGISIFGSTRVKNAFTGICVNDPKCLSVMVAGKKISSIYVPPTTMNASDFAKMLELVKDTDVLMGDFNTTSGLPYSKYEKRPSGSRDKTVRLNALLEFAHTEGMTLASNPLEGQVTSALDHIYTSPAIQPLQFTFTPATTVREAYMHSDHGMLTLKINNFLTTTTTITSESLSTRFKSIKLSRVGKRHNLIETWREHSDPWTEELERVTATPDSHTLPYDQRRLLVEKLDLSMTKSIATACAEILGTYNGQDSTEFSRHGLKEDLARITSPSEAVKAFKRACRSGNTTFTPTSDQPVTVEATTLFTDIYESPSHAPTRPTSNLDAIFTLSFHDTFEAVKNYPSNKTCGLDGINQTILMTLAWDPMFLSMLTTSYNLYLKLKVTPLSWNHSIIHLIPKENGKTCPITQSRPISLTAVIRRIFESTLLNFITSTNPTWARLHSCQGGFQQKRSTDAHILLSHLGASHPEEASQIQVFLDIRKAFDEISHNYLFSTFDTRGMDSRIAEIIYSLTINDSSCQVTVNHSATPKINRKRGIPQGSLLSPLIFNIAIDQLARNVAPRMLPFPSLLLFADDIKIQVPGYKLTETRTIITQCEKWSNEAGLTFGLAKCGVIGLKNGDTLLLNDQTIPKVTSYKYLGVPFTPFGADFNAHIMSNCEKAKAMLNFLRSQAGAGLREDIRVTLVSTYVRSMLIHAFGLWSIWQKYPSIIPNHLHNGTVLVKAQLKDLSKSERLYIFGTDNSTDTANSLAYLESFSQLTTTLQASTALRIRTQPTSSPIHRILTQPPRVFRRTLLGKTLDIQLTTQALKEPSPLSWLKETRRKQTHQDNLKSSALVSYLSLHSRINGKKDSTLSIPNPKIRRLALHWRLNTALHNPTYRISCPCQQTHEVKRTHFDRCEVFKSSGWFPPTLWQNFLTHKQHRTSKRAYWETQGHKPHHVDKITFLDWLLNKRKFGTFGLIMEKLLDTP
jgi:retron-type reverse transcriptase